MDLDFASALFGIRTTITFNLIILLETRWDQKYIFEMRHRNGDIMIKKAHEIQFFCPV